jgi:protocatechuate 3,4-dioxygenase beta subunit
MRREVARFDHDDHDHTDIHDRGLPFDLSTLMSRRRALLLGGVGAVGAAASVVGCTRRGPRPGGTTTSVAAGSCSVIPQETAGPYPGDGSNGPNVLTQSGIVRSDIRSSFGSGSATAAGVPLVVKLRVLSTAQDCAPLAGAAVYVWHCDMPGRYSMYSAGVTGENFLRGVQETDADGNATFTSIFPGAYPGRWPHVHFEIYPSLAAATRANAKLRTTQLALPEDACQAVYDTSGYEASVRNLAATPLSRDMVFSDGYSLQMAAMSGDVSTGLTASLPVPV